MGNNEKSPKEKFDSTMKTVTEKAKTKTGKITILAVVLALIVLNVFWSSMENRVISEVQTVRADIAELNKRIEGVEKGNVDLDAVKADAEIIRKTGEDFERKLNALIKAEEEKLKVMAQDTENQKTYVETLKTLQAGQPGVTEPEPEEKK